jgi:putative mRNA 3-end processing factor
MAEINAWWAANAAAGAVSILGAYALGKAQRIMAGVDASIGPILTHGAVEASTAILRAQGYPLPRPSP